MEKITTLVGNGTYLIRSLVGGIQRGLASLGDHAQNTTNPAISLVAFNVILILIGPSA